MRTSSNPVFRSLPQGRGGYARFNQQAAGPYGGAQAPGYQGYPASGYPAGGQPPQQGFPTDFNRPAPATRPLTIDDVVMKTGITLGVLTVTAIISYFLVNANAALATPFLVVGGLGGLVLVLIATFGRKQDNPAIVLSYAALEGLALGAISFVLTFDFELGKSSTNAGVMIGQAVVGTIGVFLGMLVVYKTGAIRVTPKFTRMLVAGLIGVVVLMVANLVASFFTDGGLGLRDGGPIAIIFSLVCIGLAAFSFLLDFDQADQAIRAGAPERAAWGIALGLTVTLVWLYVEILRLLSYFNNN